MLLGIDLLTLGLVVTVMLFIVWWGYLFSGFLFGTRPQVDIKIYFQAMFQGFRNSELRAGWRTLIFGIEYFLGLVALLVVQLAWYPATCIRWTISKILFSKKKAERLEREKLKDELEELEELE